MPTGYTLDVKEKNISFPEFAMNCARAFSALITMKDDSLDTPIPEKLQPDDYHKKALAHAMMKLKKRKSMTLKKAKAISETRFNKSLLEFAANLTKTAEEA